MIHTSIELQIIDRAKVTKVMNGSEDRYKLYRKRFAELDLNYTGKLNRETVAQILKEQGEELDQLMVIILFQEYDLDNDGFINCDEFIRFCTEMDQLTEKEILRMIFDICDEDHNQKLDVDEVKRLGNLMGFDVTLSDAWATIATFDSNHDNLVDFEEFCAIIGQ